MKTTFSYNTSILTEIGSADSEHMVDGIKKRIDKSLFNLKQVDYYFCYCSIRFNNPINHIISVKYFFSFFCGVFSIVSLRYTFMFYD